MCNREKEAMEVARASFGTDSPEYQRAFWEFILCNMFDKLDEKSPPFPLKISDAVEEILKGLKPDPVDCLMASVELRKDIFADKKTAMIFSNKIAEAFKEAGIKLAADKTFTCTFCVVDKPQFVSDAFRLNPVNLKLHKELKVNYVMAPEVMSPVMDFIEKDRMPFRVAKKVAGKVEKALSN